MKSLLAPLHRLHTVRKFIFRSFRYFSLITFM